MLSKLRLVTYIVVGILTIFGAVSVGQRVFFWDCEHRYSYISPVARCGSADMSYTKAYEEFQADIELWIDQETAKGTINDAAVYFRDLQNGPWFGVGENDRFLPASLFKVPVMMAVMKLAEKQPSLLDEAITAPSVLPDIPGNTDDPEKTVYPNKSYTVDDLLLRMIAYSDNISMDILVRILEQLAGGPDASRKIYLDLGVLSANDAQTISVKSYASLFRVLYNARYLSPELSEKALGMLAQSDFRRALVAGLPSHIVAAHKYGVHNIEGDRLLHDCGIIYHPVRPYLLCVMTRGNDLDKSVEFIADLSRRVYVQVEQNIVATW